MDDEAIKSWNPPKQVPSCFLSRLKEIQIKELRGKGYELEMIEYFLLNAKVLVKMTIGYRFPNDCFCGELVAFRRESKTCQLNLNCKSIILFLFPVYVGLHIFVFGIVT